MLVTLLCQAWDRRKISIVCITKLIKLVTWSIAILWLREAYLLLHSFITITSDVSFSYWDPRADFRTLEPASSDSLRRFLGFRGERLGRDAGSWPFSFALVRVRPCLLPGIGNSSSSSPSSAESPELRGPDVDVSSARGRLDLVGVALEALSSAPWPGASPSCSSGVWEAVSGSSSSSPTSCGLLGSSSPSLSSPWKSKIKLVTLKKCACDLNYLFLLFFLIAITVALLLFA